MRAQPLAEGFSAHGPQRAGRAALVAIHMALGLSLLVCAATAARGQKKQSVKAKPSPTQANAFTTADQLLKLGFFYYNNDDISDKAATNFRAVISKFPNSVEAETAQYYLGSYFQRKYYVQKATYGKPPNNLALDTAQREYLAYTDKYYKSGTHQWLADAFFNRALVFFQLQALRADNTRSGEYELNKAADAASLDNSIYIYQVVYSQNTADILDGYYPTAALAKTAISIHYQLKNFDQQIAAIRDWCRQQSPKQAR